MRKISLYYCELSMVLKCSQVGNQKNNLNFIQMLFFPLLLIIKKKKKYVVNV